MVVPWEIGAEAGGELVLIGLPLTFADSTVEAGIATGAVVATGEVERTPEGGVLVPLEANIRIRNFLSRH